LYVNKSLVNVTDFPIFPDFWPNVRDETLHVPAFGGFLKKTRIRSDFKAAGFSTFIMAHQQGFGAQPPPMFAPPHPAPVLRTYAEQSQAEYYTDILAWELQTDHMAAPDEQWRQELFVEIYHTLPEAVRGRFSM
jgi:hypothetical protein